MPGIGYRDPWLPVGPYRTCVATTTDRIGAYGVVFVVAHLSAAAAGTKGALVAAKSAGAPLPGRRAVDCDTLGSIFCPRTPDHRLRLSWAAYILWWRTLRRGGLPLLGLGAAPDGLLPCRTRPTS